MAMKVYTPVRTSSMSPGTFTDPEEVKRQVQRAMAEVQPPSQYLMEQEPRSKYRPRVDKAKKVKIKKPPKKSASSVQIATPPNAVMQWDILRRKLKLRMAISDEECYALSWDFKKDRSFLSVPYPIDPKDRARGIRKSLNSQRSKVDKQRLKAVGITPRGLAVDPKKIGSICHEAEPEFKQVVDSNSAYIKELSRRYCANCELESAIRYLRIRRVVSRKKVQVQVQVSKHAADSWQVRRENTLARVTAKLFDLYDIPAANDSVFDSLERQYECDQWPSPIDYMLYQEMCTGYRPVDTDLVGYVKWHNEAELRLPTDNQFLTDLEGWAMSDTELQGRLYMQWLQAHDWWWVGDQRRKMEEARRTVDRTYEMDLGTFIHPLEQTNPAQYKVMIDNLRTSSSRISRECLQVKTYGIWYIRSTYLVQASSVRRALQEKIHYAEIKKQEALAEKLISQAIDRLSFREWVEFIECDITNADVPELTDVVEETTQEELLTIDSEVDPIDGKDKEAVSNVIDLVEERERRAADVRKLISEFRFSFADYTVEEKEGARKFIIELYEALG